MAEDDLEALLATLPSSQYLASIRRMQASQPNPFRQATQRARHDRKVLKARLGKKEFTRRFRRGDFIGLGFVGIANMTQAAKDATEAMGLPPDAWPTVLETMYDTARQDKDEESEP